MDGMELLQRLRAQDRELPVLVATAHGEVQSAVAARCFSTGGIADHQLRARRHAGRVFAPTYR